MKKTRMRKLICRLLAAVLLISGLGSECIGAQSSLAFTQEDHCKAAAGAAHFEDAAPDDLRSSHISETPVFFEENDVEEESFEEMEREGRAKKGASLGGFSCSVLPQGLSYNLFYCWNGRFSGRKTGQFGTESIISYIHYSDGKK